MSDDTPTQRFPQPGDEPTGDIPTQRLPQHDGDPFAHVPIADGSLAAATPTERITTGPAIEHQPVAAAPRKPRGPLIALIVAGALLIVALIVLLFILFGPKGTPGAGETATPAPTVSLSPSPTPTPTPTQEPQTPPPPAITSFSTGTATVFCSDDPDDNVDELTIAWATSGGVRVYFGIDVTDAQEAPFFDNLPLSGDSTSNFPAGYSPFRYSCGVPEHTYTITVVAEDGQKTSRSVTVTDVNFGA
jgi:hypothetical protein